MKSKNHLLYELYLDEIGAGDVFEETKHISLGHIVEYVKNGYLEVPKNIDEYSDSDFAKVSVNKELDKLSEEAIGEIGYVINKINEYHKNKS